MTITYHVIAAMGWLQKSSNEDIIERNIHFHSWR